MKLKKQTNFNFKLIKKMKIDLILYQINNKAI